jgi:hypothetical protein
MNRQNSPPNKSLETDVCSAGCACSTKRRPPRSLHHLVSDSTKEEGIGLDEVLDRVTLIKYQRGRIREYR